ncbi:MAG TPA: hypothetical protein VG873_17185 [Burkholderiales bacterium]|nr:hypothetical protein [Burkholderiales bacterium]
MSVLDWPWPLIGGLLSLTVLLVGLWVNFGRPEVRRAALRTPARAYFHVPELDLGDIGYAIQDEQAHNVKELVLPSNSLVNIEVAYYPTIHFNVKELIFISEGMMDEKPLPTERFTSFVKVGKNHWIPGIDETDYIDRKGNYHVRSDASRDVGSCYVLGLKLRTQKAGLYKVIVSWMTDEIEGNATDLSIRVEDTPQTRMRCSEHNGCWIRSAKPRTSDG